MKMKVMQYISRVCSYMYSNCIGCWVDKVKNLHTFKRHKCDHCYKLGFIPFIQQQMLGQDISLHMSTNRAQEMHAKVLWASWHFNQILCIQNTAALTPTPTSHPFYFEYIIVHEQESYRVDLSWLFKFLDCF